MTVRLLRGLAMLLAALCASPVLAEKLSFDHRLYQPLKEVLDSGRDDMIQFNGKNPAYVTDLIVIRGKSTRSWTEAMIIIARTPSAKARTAAEWMAELQRQSDAECANRFSIIARDNISITFERRSQGCRPGYPANAIYRIVQGKKGLFLLGAMSKDGFTSDARTAWLALLGSAKLD